MAMCQAKEAGILEKEFKRLKGEPESQGAAEILETQSAPQSTLSGRAGCLGTSRAGWPTLAVSLLSQR